MDSMTMAKSAGISSYRRYWQTGCTVREVGERKYEYFTNLNIQGCSGN
jgi:hypothetical protein